MTFNLHGGFDAKSLNKGILFISQGIHKTNHTDNTDDIPLLERLDVRGEEVGELAMQRSGCDGVTDWR